MSTNQSLALVHDADQPALGTHDIVTRFKEEPRVADERIAEVLGFNRVRAIRQLIERNRAELAGYGEVSYERSKPQQDQSSPHGVANLGGRPATVYYLNEGQCLVLCALARTANAARIRRDIITVFMAHRAGTLKPVTAVTAAERLAGAIEAVQAAVMPAIDALKADIATVRADVLATRARALTGPIAARTTARPTGQLLHHWPAIGAYLNLKPDGARHLARSAGLPVFKIGTKTVAANSADLDAWLETYSAEVRS